MTNTERDKAIADLAQAVEALIRVAQNGGVFTNYRPLLIGLTAKMRALRVPGDALQQARDEGDRILAARKAWWRF